MSDKLKKYVVYVDTSSVEGNQGFAVLAESESDAVERYRNGDSIGIISEQLEVIGLDDNTAFAEESDHVSELLGDINQANQKTIDELNHVLSMTIHHATNGKVSKPYTDLSVIRSVIDEAQQEKVDNLLAYSIESLGENSPVILRKKIETAIMALELSISGVEYHKGRNSIYTINESLAELKSYCR